MAQQQRPLRRPDSIRQFPLRQHKDCRRAQTSGRADYSTRWQRPRRWLEQVAQKHWFQPCSRIVQTLTLAQGRLRLLSVQLSLLLGSPFFFIFSFLLLFWPSSISWY